MGVLFFLMYCNVLFYYKNNIILIKYLIANIGDSIPFAFTFVGTNYLLFLHSTVCNKILKVVSLIVEVLGNWALVGLQRSTCFSPIWEARCKKGDNYSRIILID